MKLNIQYGAGLCGPTGWKNYDSSPMLRLQRTPLLNLLPLARRGPAYPATVVYGDVVKGLPVLSGSADLVYCSHTLEHLSLGDFQKALRETYRILKPGGVFRGVLPDIHHLCVTYLQQAKVDPLASIEFIHNTHMGVRETPRRMAWLRSFFSRDAHLWMWDYASLEIELRTSGFVSVRRASFGDSDQAEFIAVEDESRWLNCLGFEAIK